MLQTYRLLLNKWGLCRTSPLLDWHAPNESYLLKVMTSRLLTKFARAAGFQELAAGTDIVPVAVEGFSGWERIRSIAWGINRTLGTSLVFAAVLDRDYHPEEEIQVVQTRLEEHAAMVHIHDRKELENYLLVPSVIERASKLVLRSSGKEEVKAPTAAQIEAILEEITTSLKSDVGGQLIA